MSGEAHVNFLGGSPLNRLSWLRQSTPFLSAIITSPNTRWVVFKNGQPLVRHALSNGEPRDAEGAQPGEAKPTHTFTALPTSAILSLLGPSPFFGQGKELSVTLKNDEHTTHTESIRIHGSPVVFLGLHEPSGQSQALPSSEFSDKATSPESIVSNIHGTPYFAVELAEAEEEAVNRVLEEGGADGKLEFMEPRTASATFSMFEAAVFAEARSMLDWNTRNQFCPGCGSSTYSLWAGWKRACTTLLPWAENTGKKPCPSGKGLNNYAHPRTDSVVIMAVVNEANDKVLLGHNRKFPGSFYSTLAGFIEPGESFEDAVKREIWEEAGVRVWGVRYHSGQPWPFPASLMVGFYAIADDTAPIRIDLDNELADARWFTREEIKDVLAHRDGSTIRRHEYKKFDDNNDEASTGRLANALEKTEVRRKDEPAFRVPPASAIAGVLIRDWVEGKIGTVSEKVEKGHL